MPIRLRELEERPVDPDCLHCVLAEPIQVFLDAHPDVPFVQSYGGLLHIAADYAASCVPEDEQVAFKACAHQLLDRLLTESFAGAVGFLRRRQ